MDSSPPIVWTPTPERIARDDHALPRWLNETRGLGFEGYAELWQWSVDELEAFWALDLGVLRGPGERAVRAGARRRARCPARSGSPARGSTTPSTSSAAATATRWRSATRPSCAPLGEWTWGELRAQRRRASRRPARRGRRGRATASSPTCRTSPRRSRRSSAARASARSGRAARRSSAPQRRRPLRPDRAEGAARRRRLPLRRQGLRPARGRSRQLAGGSCRRSSATSCFPYLAGSSDWDELLARAS